LEFGNEQLIGTDNRTYHNQEKKTHKTLNNIPQDELTRCRETTQRPKPKPKGLSLLVRTALSRLSMVFQDRFHLTESYSLL